MKKTKTISVARNRVSTRGAGGTNGNKASTTKSAPRRTFRQPKTEAQQAIQRYIDLFDFAPIGYVTFDRVGRIEDINVAALFLVGRTRRQLIGTTFAVCVAKEDMQVFLHHLLECRSSDGPVMTELHLQQRDGTKIPVELSSTATVALMTNGARLYQTAILDLTERKRAEEALRAKEAELEEIINRTPFMLIRCSRDLRYRFVSRAYAEMLGRKPEEIAGKPIVEIIGERGFKTISPYIENVLKGHTVEYESKVSFAGAGAPYLHGVYTPDLDSKGNVIGWFGSITDVTDRKKAEGGLQKAKKHLENRVRARTHELRKLNRELEAEIARRKGLEGEILSVSDREQQRLGQELHDGLCQHLTAVAFMAHSAAMRLRNHRVIDATDIEKIAQLVNDAAVDTRSLSHALHRADVDAAALINALQDLVDREIWKIPSRLQVRQSFRINDDHAAAHLYRIAREAVINANKHAQAREIVVKLERAPQGMVLRVIDDGVGFPGFANGAKPVRGLGYHIMKYRAELMGGRLEIDSPKGGGTCVSCYLPNDAVQLQKSQGSGQPKQLAEKNAMASVAGVANFKHLRGRRASISDRD
jgi:PAS domain S-box-containing protein